MHDIVPGSALSFIGLLTSFPHPTYPLLPSEVLPWLSYENICIFNVHNLNRLISLLPPPFFMLTCYNYLPSMPSHPPDSQIDRLFSTDHVALMHKHALARTLTHTQTYTHTILCITCTNILHTHTA